MILVQNPNHPLDEQDPYTTDEWDEYGTYFWAGNADKTDAHMWRCLGRATYYVGKASELAQGIEPKVAIGLPSVGNFEIAEAMLAEALSSREDG